MAETVAGDTLNGQMSKSVARIADAEAEDDGGHSCTCDRKTAAEFGTG